MSCPRDILAVVVHLSRVRRALVALVAAIAVLPMASTAGSQDLEDVERQVDELSDALGRATRAFEDIRAQVEATEDELQGLQARASELEQRAADADRAIAEQVRTMFKFGSDPVLSSLLSADGPQGAIERAAFVAAVNGRERARLEEAVALRTQLDQTRELIEDRADELARLESELAAQREAIDHELASKQALAADLRARAARQRRIDRGVQSGVYACIHDYNSFVDSWGAPRSGGRRHKGVDVMAPYNVPVYAFTNGRITRMNRGGLGGIQLYLWGDDGNEYFYAHLSGYADTAYVGKRVEAGELIAYNGDTGNARGTPHVHFELHPGGGGAINPYPYMRAAC